MSEENKKTPPKIKLNQRWSMLETERAPWFAQWRDISKLLLPMSGRYFHQDRNKGQRRYNNIYDSTGTRALRILGAGMMSGATSPARPWFRLGTGDPALNAYQPVRVWLDDVSTRMQGVFQKSNTYRALHSMYEELGAFGTATSLVLPDAKNIIHHYPYTAGEYCIATNYQGRVVTCYREFDKTIGEIVREFGLDKCSQAIKTQWEKGNYDKWWTLIHAVEPRYDRDHSKIDAKNMAWGSYVYEAGSNQEKFLRESGFNQYPGLSPRWAVNGGDVYGSGPGAEVLGDISQLQHEQLRKAQGIDYQTNPPLQVPSSMKYREVDRLPGGITYIEGQNQKIESLYAVNIPLRDLGMDIVDVRQRISAGFYADLFMMIANGTDTTKTATEIAERHEEKLLMLGPVLERLDNELNNPLIEMTFDIMLRAGKIPPAPKEMQGMELQVEFISVLAQAQKAIGTNSIDRFVSGLGYVAQMKPEVLDKFDGDAWVDVYSDKYGIDPKLIVPGDQVAMIRKARNDAQQAQAQQAAMQQQAETAKSLAQSPTGTNTNALMDVMNQYSGYNSPSAVEA